MKENAIKELMEIVEEFESSEKSEFIRELLDYVDVFVLFNILQRQKDK